MIGNCGHIGRGGSRSAPQSAAALNQQFVLPQPGPEELGVRADRRRQSGGHQLARLESQYPESLAPKHFAVLIGVGLTHVTKKPVPMAVCFSSEIDSNTVVAVITSPSLGIALDLELRVGGHGAGVAGLVEELRSGCSWISMGTPPRSRMPSSFGRRHRPGLQHDRWRDDAAVPGRCRELRVEVDGIHVVERVCPVPDHRLVHRIRRQRGLAGPHRWACR